MWFRRKKQEKMLKKGPFYEKKDALVSYVQSEKGTLFRTYFRKGYDFIVDYSSEEVPVLLEKELVGSVANDKVHIHAEFNANYKLISYKIEKGRFLTFEEYEELSKLKEEKEK